jgi:predicted amidohydrolase YtcJ
MREEPTGGRVVRDDQGRPTGLLIEAAAWQLVNPLVPSAGVDAKRQALREAQAHAHAMGLTAVGSMEYQRDVEDVFEPLRDELTLRCRITLLDRAWPMSFEYGKQFDNDDAMAVIGYKAFIDGTLGSRSARMLRDYADDPGNRGLLVELAADGKLLDWANDVAAAGLSPSMHAIGDEAARIALDVMDAIGHDSRGRIEHAQQIDVADLPRLRGRIVSMQPLHKADDCRYVRARLGDDRLAGTFAFRKLLDAGAVLAFGSDWPVVSCDPLLGIRTAVTGMTLDDEVFSADQNLTVEESLRAYTREAAFCLGMNDAGILTPGMHGDLVMFDCDPFGANWVNSPPRIVMTVSAGRVVYENATAAHASAQILEAMVAK